MRIVWIVAAALAALAPNAAAAEGWRHRPSGVNVPDLPQGFSLGRATERHEGGDVFVQFGTEQEPVTVYVYRSAWPNVALWFERTRLAMNVNVGSGEAAVEPRSFTLGASPAPNGLREEIALPAGGRFRSTAVAMAQYGEWIVKVRITSANLDQAGVRAKMDRLLASIQLPGTVPAPHPMRVPGLCPDDGNFTGRALTSSDLNAGAGAALRLAAAEARGRGGLAANPDGWCRARAPMPSQLGTLYHRRDGRGWTALLSDAGIGIAAYPIDLPDADGAATFAVNPGMTGLVQIFDHVPPPQSALEAGIQVLVGRAQPQSRLEANGR
ncbi:MAG TPA: hypothetical protein VEC11_13565 [Allosphingosinicella sp.]|nr:hypothetical protein [Allosphingosinicella sp.]